MAIKTPHHAWCYCTDIISTKGALADTRARTYSTQRERRRQRELYSKGVKQRLWGKEFYMWCRVKGDIFRVVWLLSVWLTQA